MDSMELAKDLTVALLNRSDIKLPIPTSKDNLADDAIFSVYLYREVLKALGTR